MSRAPARIALLAALGLSACVGATPDERFVVAPRPALAPFERTHAAEPLDVFLDPEFAPPTHLRACCAFGRDLRLSVARLDVPVVQIRNVVAPDMAGRHAYDAGLVSLHHGIRRGFVSSESNGLVYTCRGGFIDLAHVRDYADWTAFLARRIEASLSTGAAFELPPEGGRRFVFLRAVDRALVERVGARAIAVRIASWLAFHLSIWHEVATWFGWSAVGLFPERVSAFSPEDLYSNLLGIHLASYAIEAGAARSESAFNRSMDAALRDGLEGLGALPEEATRRALDAVDGLWWTSQRRLPDPAAVLRRNFAIGPVVSPWRLPRNPTADRAARLAEYLRQQCGPDPGPVLLRSPTDMAGEAIAEIARLYVQVEQRLAERMRLQEGRWLGQAELPELVASIERESGSVALAASRPTPSPDDAAPFRLPPQSAPTGGPSESGSIRARALAGDAAAQSRLALTILSEAEGPTDEALAFRWMERAAEAGDPAAQHYLGLFLLSGTGTEVDFERASEWLRRCAESDVPESLLSLAWFELGSNHLPHAAAHTAALIRNLAELGVVAAEQGMAGLGARSADGSARAERIRRLRAAASSGDASSQLGLGLALLEASDADAAELEQAVDWLLAAARQRHPQALRQLGIAHLVGRGVARDLPTAYGWFWLAARHGHPFGETDSAHVAALLGEEPTARARAVAARWESQPVLKSFPGQRPRHRAHRCCSTDSAASWPRSVVASRRNLVLTPSSSEAPRIQPRPGRRKRTFLGATPGTARAQAVGRVGSRFPRSNHPNGEKTA